MNDLINVDAIPKIQGSFVEGDKKDSLLENVVDDLMNSNETN